jgi:hypothetical protein
MHMNKIGSWISAAGLAVFLGLSTAALAQGTAAPAAAPKGAAVLSTTEVTATVTKINHKTREVTLKAADGREADIVVDAAVKNLDQVMTGDVITATYTEAVAYEVRKDGKVGAETTTAAAGAPIGSRPAGAIAQNTTVTVMITAIDAKVPSVTFKGPEGKTKTIKVKSVDKLQGVKVGDTVDIGYTEAVAIRVDKAPKK